MTELATRNLWQKPLSDDKQDAKDPLADMPFWLEDFTDNLKVPEMPAQHTVLGTQNLERHTKVATKSRKHSVYTHPKTEIATYACETKMTRAPCRRRNGEALPRAEKFGDLMTADHKVLNEGGESIDNNRYAVVNKILLLNGFNLICATRKLLRRRKSLGKFLEPSQAPKVVQTDNSMEFWKTCEVLAWNHRTSTPHGSETNGTAERAARRVKEGTSAVLLQSGLDERWCQTPWNAIAICEMSKTSWQMRKRHTKDDLENHSEGQ